MAAHETQGPRRREGGVGLVEIMIAMTLGLIVTGAVVQIYVTTKRQNDMQTSLTGRQESLRFAAQLIQRDAQMAGFRGCLRDLGTVANALNDANNFLYDFGQHVIGFDDSEAPPASITNVVAGTDVLTLRTVDDPGVFITAAMAANTDAPVTVAGLNPAPLAADDIALIADCGGATVFQVTAFDAGTGTISHDAGAGAPGNASTNLVRRYGPGAQVFRMRTTTYYIRASAAGTGPALWRRIGLSAPEELAEGIENLQVLYGVDADGDQSPDDYVTADAVGDWTRVVSLQVGLLAAGTQDNAGDTDTRTFQLLDKDVDPVADGLSDRRVRRAMTFTVALRNRLS
ncbi:MAG: PilW family protein [Gammaproteobacteria bacterium]|nr:PilW family protein [Gammaproteobacteria bacterium]